MKISYAKVKGRKMVTELRELLLKEFPQLEPDDVRIPPSAVPGEDLQLSPAARRLFPFAVECKNKESLNIWAAIKQAESHLPKNSPHVQPAIVFRRNNQAPYVAFPLPFLLTLLKYRTLSREMDTPRPVTTGQGVEPEA